MSSNTVSASGAVGDQAASTVAEVQKQVLCPNCGSIHFHRVQREGFLQEKVLPRFGYYPWDCRVCRKITLVRMRGKSGRRSKDEYEQHSRKS